MSSFTAQNLNEKLKAMEPIAISGMSCRLPGGVNNTSDLWGLFVEGRSGQGDIPSSRFSKDAFYHPDPDHTGTINGTGGYFLQNDVKLFDNSFFGLHNLEAKYMDPQQRQLLEVVYECLENAGESLESVSGANIGCFVANFTYDYAIMQARDPDLYHRYSATGFGPTILANRISHFFNLKGPSFVLDTACSSSLYALHMACTALNAGDCDAAIVAGANLVQSPEVFVAMAKAGVLSATSTSHTFDAAADGYGRGEGVAALYLKKLNNAVLQQGPIRSVIRGSAVNSNGHTPGITLPGVVSQEAVIRKAYATAKLDMEDTVYVEAHGTGTPVGDPIEIHALSNAFSTTTRQPLLIGSNKPNVGHSEAVSGLTSIIKATLALEKRLIPPTRGIENINPDLKLTERNIEIVQHLLPWPTGRSERVSVNAFGYGGSNAHAIIDSAAMYVAVSEKLHGEDVDSTRSVLLPFSAHCPESLARNVEAVATLELAPSELSDLAYTLAMRRSRLAYRSYMIGTSTRSGVHISRGLVPPTGPPSELTVGFVFTGQGAQWPGMGRQLLGRFPAYESVIDDLDMQLHTLPHAPSWTIKQTLLESAEIGSIYKADRSQTICAALQIALVELLREWGVQPVAVVGHSSGEIAAAFAAGHISAHEALAIAYYRGLISEKIPQEGAMLAVGLDAEQTTELLLDLRVQDTAKVACVNSSESTTVSGETSAVEAVFQALQERNIFVRKLRTDGKAYHSHLTQSVSEEYEKLLVSVLCQTPFAVPDSSVKMFSTVTAEPASRDLVRKPSYWRRNLESPVLFKDALELLVKDGSHHLVEIGPHPALGQPVRDIVKSIPDLVLRYSYSLYRGKSDELCILQLAGQLFTAGVPLQLSNINDRNVQDNADKDPVMHGSQSDTHSINDVNDSGVEDLSERGGPSSCDGEDVTEPVKNSEKVTTMAHTICTTTASNTSRMERNVSSAVNHIPSAQRRYRYKSRVFQRMPPYAWHHQAPLWVESRLNSEFRNNKHRKHDLLGSRVLATSGNLAIWRNQLKLTEASWIQDHRLGSTIVFPAAGYIAMAIEALLQMNDRPNTGCVTLRHVYLMNMLILSAANKEGIEVSTVLEPDQMSQTTASGLWWRFRISSFAAGSFTVHASGLIGLKTHGLTPESRFAYPEEFGIEEQATRTMYNRLATQGLCFGPQFQSMKTIFTDRHRRTAFAGAEISFRNGGCHGKGMESEYMVHPITIDSILQSGIIASCKGASSELYGKVPVEVGSLEIILQDLPPASAPCSIRANSRSVGFDAVLLGGELQDESGRIIARVENVRAINYRETSLAPKSTLQRNPALRIIWKPDISSISQSSSHALKEYTKHFQQYLPSEWAIVSEHVYLAAMVDLLTHKHGRMAILELGEESDSDFSQLVQRLSLSHAPRRYRTYTRGKIDDAGSLHIYGPTQEAQRSSFNLIIIPSIHSKTIADAGRLSELLAPNGVLLFTGGEDEGGRLSNDIFSKVSFMPRSSGNFVTLARKTQISHPNSTWDGPIIVVHDGNSDGISDGLGTQIHKTYGNEVQKLHVDELMLHRIPSYSVVISTLEFSSPFLSTMDQKQQLTVTTLAENASVLLWITGGGLFKSQHPEAATILGLARTLMLERPSLKMPVLDLDKHSLDIARTSKNIMAILSEVLREPNPDLELREHNGTLHISRFIPDVTQNQAFRRTQDAETVQRRISDVSYARLGLKAVGQIDTLRFEEKMQPLGLKPGYVRVEVQAVGLNAKDLYALSDKISINGSTCGLEFSGTVNVVGSSDSALAPGDRVVVMAPHHFGTIEDVPEWACCKLKDGEDPVAMATVPLVFSTALYALEQRARIEEGQSILIHSGAGGLGIAAIQVARMLGAEVFTTVGTKEKRIFLNERFGIPDDHIFDSHSASFVKDLLDATSGRGVDVILNSLTGDLLHEGWEALAPFGTFVEVGKRDIADCGRLNMRVFDRAATFTAFDLTDLFWATSERKRQVWSRLLQRSVSLIRHGFFKPISPLRVFPASEIVQAFRHFASGKRMGKVAVVFDKDQNIPVVPFKYHTRLNAHKSYLLVGCLGGLGRSISRWMLQLGARNFTFIGRSGTDKPSAAKLVADLTAAGATVKVCKGSVANRAVVQNAVDSSAYPIGGVIQASMAIHVSLFKDMDNSTWHAGINQKIQGTWNLHHALEGQDSQLDFFLMLSSITGSIGTATESNYCAANSFLDAFGSYRRSLGLPAVALGLGMISEVGFLHENPETEAVLLRKGVHPFTEAELLQIIDISLTDFPADPSAAIDDGFGLEHEMKGHILTGLELHGFQKIRDQGFVRGTKVLEDPRCTYIAGAFAENSETSEAGQSANSGSKLAHAVRVALAENCGSNKPNAALVEVIKATVVKQIASLLLVNEESFKKDTLLADFGMESMLAAEFRSDMYRAFNVDVPFAVLLDKRTQVRTVAETIGRSLLQGVS